MRIEQWSAIYKGKHNTCCTIAPDQIGYYKKVIILILKWGNLYWSVSKLLSASSISQIVAHVVVQQVPFYKRNESNLVGTTQRYLSVVSCLAAWFYNLYMLHHPTYSSLIPAILLFGIPGAKIKICKSFHIQYTKCHN